MVGVFHAVLPEADVLPDPRVVHGVELHVEHVFDKEDHVLDVVAVLALVRHLKHVAICKSGTHQFIQKSLDGGIHHFLLLNKSRPLFQSKEGVFGRRVNSSKMDPAHTSIIICVNAKLRQSNCQ